jgi:hypothetical protein
MKVKTVTKMGNFENAFEFEFSPKEARWTSDVIILFFCDFIVMIIIVIIIIMFFNLGFLFVLLNSYKFAR